MGLRGGRYETLRRIASGGMARVFLARALGAGGFERLVALKALHDHLAEEQDFIDMFLDEARLAARIRHPNVVGTIDVQQDDEGVFLVMDYVEGPTVATALRELRRLKRPLPIDIALRIFLDTLAGLHAAHELTDASGEPVHLVHRDVSPQNILIGVDGVARLTDFGIARAKARMSTTRDGDVKGKGPYMAPEQVNAEPVDRRTDIYAAGALFWELLTGEVLVKGDNDGAIVMGVLREEKPSPRLAKPSLPKSLCDACLRALAFRPDDRYPTAAEFADAVEAAARDARVVPAKPRTVAALVKQLAVHEAPVDLPASTLVPVESKSRSSVSVIDASARKSLASLSSIDEARSSRPDDVAGEEARSSKPEDAPLEKSPSPAPDSASEAPASSDNRKALSSQPSLVKSAAPSSPAPARGRTAVFAVGALVAIAAVGALAMRRGPAPAAAPSPVTPPPPAVSAAPPAPAIATSAPPAVSATAPVVPSAEPSGASTAAAAPSSSAPARKPGKMPRVIGPGYNPTEL